MAATFAVAAVLGIAAQPAAADRSAYFVGGAHLSDELDINLAGDLGKEGLSVYVDRGVSRRYEATSYDTGRTGHVTRAGLRGPLGALGHADMRFVQHGRRQVTRFRCIKYVEIPGRLVGNLRFRGEGGYVHAHERVLRGSKRVLDDSRCEDGRLSRAAREPATLTACGEHFFDYQAERIDGRSTLTVFGSSSKSTGC